VPLYSLKGVFFVAILDITECVSLKTDIEGIFSQIRYSLSAKMLARLNYNIILIMSFKIKRTAPLIMVQFQKP
jgi:hypothetical protein